MKTSSSDKECFPNKESFITIIISMCFSFILCLMLAEIVKDNKILINKLQYEIEQLQIKDESMIQYLNSDEVRFMIEQYDSVDMQLTNHLDMILENKHDIVILQSKSK